MREAIASFGKTMSSVPELTDTLLSFPINSLLTQRGKVLIKGVLFK